jgi:hypothetical protein
VSAAWHAGCGGATFPGERRQDPAHRSETPDASPNPVGDARGSTQPSWSGAGCRTERLIGSVTSQPVECSMASACCPLWRVTRASCRREASGRGLIVAYGLTNGRFRSAERGGLVVFGQELGVAVDELSDRVGESGAIAPVFDQARRCTVRAWGLGRRTVPRRTVNFSGPSDTDPATWSPCHRTGRPRRATLGDRAAVRSLRPSLASRRRPRAVLVRARRQDADSPCR